MREKARFGLESPMREVRCLRESLGSAAPSGLPSRSRSAAPLGEKGGATAKGAVMSAKHRLVPSHNLLTIPDFGFFFPELREQVLTYFKKKRPKSGIVRRLREGTRGFLAPQLAPGELPGSCGELPGAENSRRFSKRQRAAPVETTLSAGGPERANQPNST